MKKRQESNTQADVVKWFNNNHCLKNMNPRCYIFSVQNELPRQLASMIASKVPLAIRNIVETSLKICLAGAINMGMRKGVSDIIVLLPRKVLFVELKSEIGKQRAEQIEFQKIVEALGFKYYICRTLEDFQNVIQDEK